MPKVIFIMHRKLNELIFYFCFDYYLIYEQTVYSEKCAAFGISNIAIAEKKKLIRA